MAHRITYKPSGIILSSDRGDIGIEVDSSYVNVTLTAPGNIIILSERYYAYANHHGTSHLQPVRNQEI